jgi:hypothetical protein
MQIRFPVIAIKRLADRPPQARPVQFQQCSFIPQHGEIVAIPGITSADRDKITIRALDKIMLAPTLLRTRIGTCRFCPSLQESTLKSVELSSQPTSPERRNTTQPVNIVQTSPQV